LQFIMKHKKLILLMTAVYCGVFFCINLMATGIQGENSDEKGSGKLVRVDLLKPKAKEIKSPMRNIFMERKIEGIPDLDKKEKTGIAGSLEGLDLKGGEEEGQGGEIDQKKIFGYDIKYLGYIASFGKKVALILYRGEAVAVEKGSILPGGIEILDISLDNVTVKSSGSDKMVIKLEGEEK